MNGDGNLPALVASLAWAAALIVALDHGGIPALIDWVAIMIGFAVLVGIVLVLALAAVGFTEVSRR